jgi:hypothetical protein
VFRVRGAVVDNPLQRITVITGTPRRTPDGGNAKLTTTTLFVVVRTVDFPPCMTSAYYDTPAIGFSVLERFLDFFLRVV